MLDERNAVPAAPSQTWGPKVVSINDARRRREQKAERPVTKAEIAEHFKVSTRTISRWMADDAMPYEKRFEGGVPRFYVSECEDWFRCDDRQARGTS
jgi:predicted DNA-binding transcriptional regulator AlpA